MPKKPEQPNLMQLQFYIEYNQVILLTYDKAAKLLELLNDAYLLKMDYNRDNAHIEFQPEKEYFSLKPQDMKTFENICKAQVLGINFNDYEEQLALEEQQNVTE